MTICENTAPALEAHELLEACHADACVVCGLCANTCPVTNTPGAAGWDSRKVMRLIGAGLLPQVVASDYPWLCTGCGRCAGACPQGVDLPGLMAGLKALRPRDSVPGSLHKGTATNLATGNNLGIGRVDYLEGMAELGAELAEECPGFYVPVDKPGADVLFFPNSKEVYGDYEDQFWWWRIFHAAKADWTVPSENWEAVDWALFSGNPEANLELARRKIELAKRLGVKRVIMPDCGGGSYGFRKGMQALAAQDPSMRVEFLYIYDYLLEVIREGRIRLDTSRNAGKTFTFHDSCKHGRELERNFGHGYFDEPREILAHCVDDFVELSPGREKNYCCGAGGGMWPMPYEEQSAWHARYKYEQLQASGADVVVVGCSNCRDQLMKRLPRYYPDARWEVRYLWQVVAETLAPEPWSEAEVARGRAEAAAQWERLGIDADI